jgi:hypothetical protein
MPGRQRTLRIVELTARGIDQFWQGDISVIEKCQLPLFGNGHGSGMLWPPARPLPQKPLGVAMHDQVLAMMSARQPTEDERIAESARVMKFYEDQEAGRIRLKEEAEARDRAQEVERLRLRDGGEPRHQ